MNDVWVHPEWTNTLPNMIGQNWHFEIRAESQMNPIEGGKFRDTPQNTPQQSRKENTNVDLHWACWPPRSHHCARAHRAVPWWPSHGGALSPSLREPEPRLPPVFFPIYTRILAKFHKHNFKWTQQKSAQKNCHRREFEHIQMRLMTIYIHTCARGGGGVPQKIFNKSPSPNPKLKYAPSPQKMSDHKPHLLSLPGIFDLLLKFLRLLGLLRYLQKRPLLPLIINVFEKSF